jgi:CBS domain containing-hemolysin-like protein
MSVVLTLLGLVGFVVLTAGTALFVAAEFSLTALERSTVDANARRGDRLDSYVQRAHRTLSFQLSPVSYRTDALAWANSVGRSRRCVTSSRARASRGAGSRSARTIPTW